MAEESASQGETRGWLARARLGIGLAAGLALFALHRCFVAKLWPATAPGLYWALVLFAALWPVVLLGGLGALRRRTLIVWSAGAGVLILALAAYDIWRQPAVSPPAPSPQAVLAMVAALFIGHHLVAGGDADRRWIAAYPTYYDIAWKDAVQLALSAAFTGVFWALLFLGAELFRLIGIAGFRDMIQNDWFSYPATGLVFAAAVHLTDVRASLTRGVRTIGLALLSWLTPLMALIAAAFLVALPFTGLGPLWKTGAAANVLLASAAALIVLLNATYHDGTAERRPAGALRWAGRITGVLVLPLVLIAAYGILVRVGQHGWTPQRIIALACALLGACYGAGYLRASLGRGAWMRPLERTNVVAGFAAIAVIVALFSPIADPARISVADQVARLRSGATSLDSFDFPFLRFGGQRFGLDALARLEAFKGSPTALLIAQKAGETRRLKNRWDAPTAPPRRMSATISVYPEGATLPQGFLTQRWQNPDDQLAVGPCIAVDKACDGFLADLDGDGAPEVLLAGADDLWVYKADARGRWVPIGRMEPMNEDVRKQLRAGPVTTVPSPWKDLKTGTLQLRLQPRSSDPPQLRPATAAIR